MKSFPEPQLSVAWAQRAIGGGPETEGRVQPHKAGFIGWIAGGWFGVGNIAPVSKKKKEICQ